MSTRIFSIIILLFVAFAATALNPPVPSPDTDRGGERHQGVMGAHIPQTRATTDADRPGHVGARPLLLGFAINAHHIGQLDLYLESVDEITAIGANAMVLVTPWFQQRIDSVEIVPRQAKGPQRDQLLAILKRAKQQGLQTALLPIVLVESKDEGEWRGVIEPADWDAWWHSYERFMSYFTELAVEADVDLLSVGSELNSTELQTDRWHQVIERVRTRFDGKLTYSANWDRYRAVSFWDQLDAIGISAYFELADEGEKGDLPELIAGWVVERDRLLAHARMWDRPLVILEVGYPSLPWASAHPWNYVAAPEVVADHHAQALGWQAFFEAWSPVAADPLAPFGGVYCYHWDPYHSGGPRDTGYGVAGKPGHEVIRRGFAYIREAVDQNADENADGYAADR